MARPRPRPERITGRSQMPKSETRIDHYLPKCPQNVNRCACIISGTQAGHYSVPRDTWRTAKSILKERLGLVHGKSPRTITGGLVERNRRKH